MTKWKGRGKEAVAAVRAGQIGRWVLVANVALISFSVALFVGYLVLTNQTAARGFMVRTVENQIAELRRQADRLDMEVVAMQSMGNIEGQVGELGLVPVDELEYLTIGAGAVAIK